MSRFNVVKMGSLSIGRYTLQKEHSPNRGHLGKWKIKHAKPIAAAVTQFKVPSAMASKILSPVTGAVMVRR
ncbi:MAG: hypothetical protein KKE51_11880 [Gammaproteobacteria bacterium]|jgi:hypothetical protein|uniref:hypothetical protein n=1 Tax=Achromobacter ruhlandii TaxID=72557 RepID=UPI0011D8AF19|nr:hypothetical protein [Achromobacter ruhlandii]MBU1364509.1 hypothetical protein [Gammaproteobacteria bacterium]TXT28030.1 MAG: hypothetical protein FD131_3410 [Rhodocyclaceae bacterium]MBU1601993.1 hypothetical protein [Gammaproteobacteria bacterium]MBU2433970.1 hypothetical protein [Gammaproteobacteria bacterium]MBU2447794.1 hypothetical protein [Gammaproteobacteria bacterium]